MLNTTLLLQPLMSLIKKSAVFVLGKDQQNLLKQAKRALLNSVTLQHLFLSAQVQLNTDASQALLMQPAICSSKSSITFWRAGNISC